MTENLTPFAVVYGSERGLFKAFSSYPFEKPKLGDFVVVEEPTEGTILCRIESCEHDTGLYCSSEDELKSIVFHSFASKANLTDQDKKWLCSYKYLLKPLVVLKENTWVESGITTLPVIRSIVKRPHRDEVSKIINHFNPQGVTIGEFNGGANIDNIPVKFSLEKLFSKRTMVFAQSGYGKTNFIKVLLFHLTKDDNTCGKLIFDLNGEYSTDGYKTYGFCSIMSGDFADKVSIYSDRDLSWSPSYKGKVLINTINDISIDELLVYAPINTDVMRSFLLYLKDDPNSDDFMRSIDTYIEDPSLLHRRFPDFFSEKDKSAKRTITAIKKRISFLRNSTLHDDMFSIIPKIFQDLKEKKTVIIDLSTKDSYDCMIIASVITRKLFENNKLNFSSVANSGEVIPTLLFFEEAQNILSEDHVRDNSNIFVRVAKEGRKYELGLVGITQRPSAIADEIRTQTDNFFCFHLSNMDDIDTLIRSNIAFDGLVKTFIQNVYSPGNMYMLSIGQSFVIPVRVTYFEDMVAPYIIPERRFPHHKSYPLGMINVVK